MQLEILPVGPLAANCYLLSDGGQIAILDPGGEPERILARCQSLKVTPSLILLTHGHVDHIAAACAIKAATNATVLVHEGDRDFIEHPHPYFAQMVGGVVACEVDGGLADGQELTFDETVLRVLHTPGHSPGSVCFLTDGVIFTGDTLFAGSVGRTDLPGGDWETLLRSLRQIIDQTTPETVVYPGHGPASTIAEEMADNPFLAELQ